jgi:high frequency lysogenization protein
MYLERKIAHDKAKLNILSRRVKQAISQANYFTGTHPTVLASLASIYVDLFGSYSFRIQVLGAAEVLNKVEIANKIRALLLAGIRSAVLWRQVGGGRLQLIFSRYKIFQITQQLILAIQTNKPMS